MASMKEGTTRFRNRPLTDPDRVFEHNAWDDVEWTQELEAEALAKVEENSSERLPADESERLEAEAAGMWDRFYGVHQNRFFKDRQWLFSEFPELLPPKEAQRAREAEADAEAKEEEFPGSGRRFRVLEVGCGVGNTLFPLVTAYEEADAFVYGCDFSPRAISIVREHPLYSARRCHAFVHDVTAGGGLPFPKGSLDAVVMIFVLSAIRPDRFAAVVSGVAEYLRPGGSLLLRDYGRYDLAQMRFRSGRCLEENFYARGDGTRVYFFTQEELRALCVGAGLEEVQNYVDRRLQVNRGRQLKMYRVWVQCKYRRPSPDER